MYNFFIRLVARAGIKKRLRSTHWNEKIKCISFVIYYFRIQLLQAYIWIPRKKSGTETQRRYGIINSIHSSSPSYKAILSAMKKSGLTRGVTSLEEDTLVVIYYLSESEIWHHN